jgi:transposase
MATGVRIRLTAEQQAEWARRWWEPGTTARERVRLGIVHQSWRGRSVPRIAVDVGLPAQTVRRVVTRFLAEGFAGLVDRARSGRPATLKAADLAAVEALLDAAALVGQTWTAPRLATWLAETRGVRVNAEYLGARLRQRDFRWKRTKRSVRHKRMDPDLQRRKEAELEVLTL